MDFDVLIPLAMKDLSFVPRVIKYIRKNIIDADTIYVVANLSLKQKFYKIVDDKNCVFIDENNMIPYLTFSRVQDLLWERDKKLSVGWYYQQFLKYAFALSNYSKKYYLTWDADTLPLRPLSFFDDRHPFFTQKHEYNPNYFSSIYKLFGLEKRVDFSFIAEHMLFVSDIVKQLVAEIEDSNVAGKDWVEKIIAVGDYSSPGPTFSEFETYGTFVMAKFPDLYRARSLNTFRCGGFIQGRNITDEKLGAISFDTDTISFELGHYPLFPYDVPIKIRIYILLLKQSFRKYTFKLFLKRLLVFAKSR